MSINQQQGVVILGSTGSIGQSTIDVLQKNKDRFKVIALTAHKNWQKLWQQIQEWEPAVAVIGDPTSASELEKLVKQHKLSTAISYGANAIEEVAAHSDADIVVAGIVGASGLLPSLNAAKAGKKILLANKEALVMSGELFMSAVSNHFAVLLPIDSEHNAIFQCLEDHRNDPLAIKKIILTASGGPFRTFTPDQLSKVTPEQACKHPNWDMGKKISVDSASMMNKGLEIIEACWLFDMPIDQVDVLVHPQSIIHSMVAYRDGSLLAQLGNPDMRTPIAHALAWPARIESGVDLLDLAANQPLEFNQPDHAMFPALNLAKESFALGGTASAILNAANEVAVAAFLNNRIGFLHIADTVRECLDKVERVAAIDIETILAADQEARYKANEIIQQRAL